MSLTLLNRIYSKAKNALNSVGNYFNPESNNGNNFWSTNFAKYLGDVQNGYNQNGGLQQFSLPHAMASGKLNTGVKPLDYTSQAVGKYMKNAWIEPLSRVPQDTLDIFKPKQTIGQRALSVGKTGLDILSGIPDPTEIPLAGYNALKGVAAESRNTKDLKDLANAAVESATWEKTPGLGEAFSSDPDAQLAGNIAELPIMLAAGTLKPKTLDANTQMVSRALKERKISLEEGRALLKEMNPNLVTQVRNTADVIKKYYASKKNPVNFIADEAGNVSKVIKNSTKVDELRTAARTKILQTSGEIAGQLEGAGKEATKLLPGGEGKSAEKTIKEAATNTKGGNLYQRWFYEPVRYFSKTMPEELYKTFKETVLNKRDEALGAVVNLKKNVEGLISDLGPEFKSGSKISELTQKYGEKLPGYDLDSITATYGKETALQVTKADTVFRQIYDTLLDDVINPRRLAAGLDEIKKRDDYYKHISEMGGLGDNIADILSTGQKTTGRTASIASARKTNKTVYDAVDNMIKYLNSAGQAAFIDPVAVEAKKFAKGLMDAKGDPSVASDIVGWADKSLMGIGNETSGLQRGLNKVASIVRGNKVLGNISSVLKQPANLATAIPEMGADNFSRGVANLGENLQKSKSSNYLKDRLYSTPLKFTKGVANKSKAVLGKIMQDFDGGVSQAIWSGFYEKAKALGESNPMQYADDYTRKFMGDRGIGGLSKFQGTFLGQLIAPFTLESTASANNILEWISKAEVGKLAGYMVIAYGSNQIGEQLGLGSTLFDPIGASVDAYNQWRGTDKKEANKVTAIGRLVAEGLQLSPPVQGAVSSGFSIANIIDPEHKVIPYSSDIFGSEDPTRYGNPISLYLPNVTSPITGSKLADVPLNLLFQYSPFGGGNQAKKTLSGLITQSKGYVENKKGNISFPTGNDPISWLKALALGPNATKAANEYYDNDYSRPLTETQTKIFKGTGAQESRQGYYENVQKSNKAKIKTEGALASGKTADADSLSQYYFKGKTYSTATTNKEKEDIMKKIGTVMDDETLTDEQKQQIVEIAGVDKDTLSYYRTAAMNDDDKMSYISDFTGNVENSDDLIKVLAYGRKRVGGKQIVTSDVIDRLYDEGKISKDQKSLLTAIKYDSVYGKYYIDRDYKGGGLSTSEKKTLMNKINTLYSPEKVTSKKIKKTEDFFSKELTSGSGLTFNKPGEKTKSRWFRTY